ncbi:hypothetical protein BMF94_4803 [Rhodotorula taiwanensis]|uniref:Peptidase M20 domain-containing protein 2 n=1 Tax=Rhodotorula taiwanensis TaxID=741276 RepID=A0A2S5B5Y4_9BASI|nr:hypothetical protein BMF94_4803 [Rhodotorula taiwanensis]
MVSAHEYDEAVQRYIRDIEDDLRKVSMSIHDRPEVGWEEYHAHKVLTDFMDKQDGFKVTRHAYDLETAWSAVFTSSAAENAKQVPTIGFNSEMDALKGLGHACGHNLIAIAGCASAVATARALEEFSLPGRVILLGTPAEEGGGGKAIMLERDAYKGMDACLMLHPGGGQDGKHGAGVITSNCISGIKATFHGVSSHAGATPELAVNALDAAFVAYSAISALRQQLAPGTKVHGIITGSDEWSPNEPIVIPSKATMLYGLRTESSFTLADLIPRVLRCFEGAATATGCSLELEREHLYLELRQSGPLAKEFAAAAARCWHSDDGESYHVEMHAKTGASTDFGNVSYHVPALHPMFNLPEAGPKDQPHAASYAKTTALPSSHEATLRASTALALTALKVLTSKDLRDEMYKAWKEDLKAIDAEHAIERLHKVLPEKQGARGKSSDHDHEDGHFGCQH